MSDEYCIYLRKSRADENNPNTDAAEILGRHEKALRELANSMDLNISQIYREVVSGDTIASRPVVQQLLADVESGIWAGVLVMEIERLARGDTVDQGIISHTFKYSNTKIITPLKIYNTNDEFDEEYFEFGLFMSRREYKAINRRLQRGRIASVKEGKFLGSIPPYGYDRIYDRSIKGYTLKINDIEAEGVRLIYDLYTKGITNQYGLTKRLNISEICSELQNLGIYPRKSKKWSASTIREILTNPVYIGKIRWNNRKTINTISNGTILKSRPRSKPEDWILVDGMHEAIISPKTFDSAQYYMNIHTTTLNSVKRKTVNPLTGLIICSECNHKMTIKKYKNNTPTGIICTTQNCGNIGSGAYWVEERILEALQEWLNGYELNLYNNFACSSVDITDNQKRRLNEINHELSELNTQEESVYDLLEQGIYTLEIFNKRLKSISIRKKELIRIKKYLQENKIKNDTQNEFISYTKDIINLYNFINNPKIKNEILRELIEKVVYTKHKKGSHKNPDNFEIVIYPKIQRNNKKAKGPAILI